MNWILILLCVIFLWCLGGDASAADTVTAGATLQDSLVTIINQVQSGVSAGVSFLQAEIPDVIRQLLTWKLAEAGFWVVLQTITGLVGVFLIARGLLAIHKNNQLEAAVTAADKAVDRSSYREDGYPALCAALTAARLEDGAFFSALITRCIGGGIGIICVMIFITNVVDNALTALQIWIAPKVWLIEYAASLVK